MGIVREKRWHREAREIRGKIRRQKNGIREEGKERAGEKEEQGNYRRKD